MKFDTSIGGAEAHPVSAEQLSAGIGMAVRVADELARYEPDTPDLAETVPTNQTAFLTAIGQAARASMAATGVPAAFVTAQAALESNWGRSRLATAGMNLFGVKADSRWEGPTLDLPTREYLGGRWVTVMARWRKYTDWRACIDDHADFFKRNRRYGAALQLAEAGAGSEPFARAIAAAGYATDPAYADKLISLVRRYALHGLDAPVPPAVNSPSSPTPPQEAA